MLSILNQSQSAETNSANCSIPKPTGLSVGNLMVATITIRTINMPVTAPDGWSKMRRTGISGSSMEIQSFYKIANAVDVAASTFDFAMSNPVFNMGGIVRFSGAGHPVVLDREEGSTNSSVNFTPSAIRSDALYVIMAGSDELDTWTINGATKHVEAQGSAVMSLVMASSITPGSITNVGRSSSIGFMAAHSFYVEEVSNIPPQVESIHQSNWITTSGCGLPIPNGLAVGDLMVAIIMRDAQIQTPINAPSGWTLINQAIPIQAARGALYSYWKIATAADIAGGSFEFGWTGSALNRGGIYRITNFDTANPIADETWDEDGTSRAPNIFATDGSGNGAVFVPGLNNLIIANYAGSSNSAGCEIPIATVQDPLWTERWDLGDSQSFEFASFTAPRQYNTQLGNVSISGSNSMTGIASFIAINPFTGSPSASLSPSISPSASQSPSSSVSSSRSVSISTSPSASSSASTSPSSSVSPSPSAEIPISSVAIMTAMCRVQQNLRFPQYVIGGVGAGGTSFGLFKKASTYGFHIWRTPLQIVGAKFTISEIHFPIIPGVTDNMDILPVLYMDNKTLVSLGNRIDKTTYPNRESYIYLTAKNFNNKVNGKNDFFLEFRWFGTALAVPGLPIKFIIDVNEA